MERVTLDMFAKLTGLNKTSISSNYVNKLGMPNHKGKGKLKEYDIQECYDWAVKNNLKKLVQRLENIIDADNSGLLHLNNKDTNERKVFEINVDNVTKEQAMAMVQKFKQTHGIEILGVIPDNKSNGLTHVEEFEDSNAAPIIIRKDEIEELKRRLDSFAELLENIKKKYGVE